MTLLYSLLYENHTPDQFILQLKKIKKYEEKKKFIEANLKELGLGSSRRVFYLDANRVLKLSLSSHYPANRIEIDNYRCFKKGSVMIVAKVLDYDEDTDWLIMEKAITFKSRQDYEKVTNNLMQLTPELIQKFEDAKKDKEVPYYYSPMTSALLYGRRDEETLIGKLIYDHAVRHSKFFDTLITIIRDCNFPTQDTNWHNWGMIGDRVVLIDYGFE